MTPCACTRTTPCPTLARWLAEQERLLVAIRNAPFGSAERVRAIQQYDSVTGHIRAHRRAAAQGAAAERERERGRGC